MSRLELPKEPKFYDYNCPIDKIVKQVHDNILKQEEDLLMYEVEHSVGFVVDKTELIKALNYDREQYDKGYRDGAMETFKAELEEIKAEVKEWYWQSDKQELAKDPCVVDAMIDLFIRTIDNRIKELEEK